MSLLGGITVWFGGIEKRLTGVSRHTTCDEIIYALLSREGALDTNPCTYGLFEQWRDVHKHLPGRSKLVKIWNAWGAEQRNVKFVLKKVSSTTYTSRSSKSKMKFKKSKKTSRAKKQCEDPVQVSTKGKSREQLEHRLHVEKKRDYSKNRVNGCSIAGVLGETDKRGDRPDSRERHKQGAQCRSGNVERSRSREDGKNRRAHTSQERYQHGASRDMDAWPVSSRDRHVTKSPDGRRLEHLVQLIISQDQKIRDQQERLREIDVQIELFETRTHNSRIKEDGQNYVQDAYMSDFQEESDSDVSLSKLSTSELQEYMNMCENVLELNKQIVQCEESVHDISAQILDETLTCEADSRSTENAVDQHITKIRKDIQQSVSERLKQENEYGEILQQLEQHEFELERKMQFFDYLLQQMSLVESSGKDLRDSSTRDVVKNGTTTIVDDKVDLNNEDESLYESESSYHESDSQCGVYRVSKYHNGVETSSDEEVGEPPSLLKRRPTNAKVTSSGVSNGERFASGINSNEKSVEKCKFTNTVKESDASSTTSQQLTSHKLTSQKLTPHRTASPAMYETIFDVSPIEKRVSFSDDIEVRNSYPFGIELSHSKFNDNDSNSDDTGLSSLHSSEELGYILETLV